MRMEASQFFSLWPGVETTGQYTILCLPQIAYVDFHFHKLCSEQGYYHCLALQQKLHIREDFF